MSNFKTEQELFWAGEFGTNYIKRNNDENLMLSNVHFFSDILKSTKNIESVIEFGANIGMNLVALKKILPDAKFTGVEINKDAVSQLEKIENVEPINESILELSTEEKWDFTFTKGVLIHIKPESLPIVYEKLYKFSNRWICIGEYYNPVPVNIDYRGHSERLYKRDFAGEMLQKFSDLQLVDYGFAYHNDPQFPQDDITWFLMEKK